MAADGSRCARHAADGFTALTTLLLLMLDDAWFTLLIVVTAGEMDNVIASRNQRRRLRGKLKRFGHQGSAPEGASRRGASSRRIIVVRDTLLYRHLATTELLDTDVGVEVGCSYGSCTALISEHCSLTIGIDFSQSCIEACNSAYSSHPSLRFDCTDLFAPSAAAWAQQSGACNATVLFLDIGGNRTYSIVIRALRACHALMPHLRLCVVKSKELRNFLRARTAPASVADHLSRACYEHDDNSAGSKSGDVPNEAQNIELLRSAFREVVVRGGEIPLALLLTLQPQLRFVAGSRKEVLALLGTDPRLQVVDTITDTGSGKAEPWQLNFRLRVRLTIAPGPVLTGSRSSSQQSRGEHETSSRR